MGTFFPKKNMYLFFVFSMMKNIEGKNSFPYMEITQMNTPEWLRPGLYGAAAGAVALAIIGFSWGGWVTGGTAEQMASDQARLKVVAALAPICVEQSKLDPQSAETFTKLTEAQYYQRNEILIKAGWATMPGSSDPSRDIASMCLEKLAEHF